MEMKRSLFRFSSQDGWLVALAVFQAAVISALWFLPHRGSFFLVGSVLFATMLWWNANTVSHNHIHNPLFRSRPLNRAFSLFLTLTTGVPQTLWKRRHLWHHAGEPPQSDPKLQLGAFGIAELVILALAFVLGAVCFPRQFFLCYLPGYLLGMWFCYLQGYHEHSGLPVAVEPGVSYYGPAYNLFWCNDGYHAEHHRYPTCHWTELPSRRLLSPPPSESSLPPLLRGFPWGQRLLNRIFARLLVWLEQLARTEGVIQRFMLSSHERALRLLLEDPRLGLGCDSAPQIGIVGGGLFPRTALLLHKILPRAKLVIIDSDSAHVAYAKEALSAARVPSDRLSFFAQRFDPQSHCDFALLVFPLGYLGDRKALYQPRFGQPPRLIHDWFFRRKGERSVLISPWLAKRLNLVVRTTAPSQEHADDRTMRTDAHDTVTPDPCAVPPGSVSHPDLGSDHTVVCAQSLAPR